MWQNVSVQHGHTPTLRILSGLVKLDATKGLPSRIKILNWGVNQSVHGPVILDATTVAQFQANQKKIGRERVALDFEHNTVPGTEEYKRTNEPRAVAAFASPVIVPNDGLYLESLTWTPAGNTSALNFEDLSAAPMLDDQGRMIALHSAALTKAGAVYDLPTFLEQAEIKAMSAILTPNKNMNTLDSNNVITVAEFAPVVGLAATASKADVLGKLAFLTALSALSGVIVVQDGKVAELAGLTLKDGKVTALSGLTALENFEGRLKVIESASTKGIATLSATLDGKVVTLNAEDLVKLHGRVETLSATLTSTAAQADAAERARLLDEAGREGKVIPLSADTIKTVATPALREMIAGLPKGVVPLHARKKPVEGQAASGLTGLARSIAAHQAEQNH